MTKIVYNSCFGGFSLSRAGVERYAQIKGIKLFPEVDPKYGSIGIITYWTVPPEERRGILSEEEFMKAPMEAGAASNKRSSEIQIDDRDIPRDDPALAQTVEELGSAANGQCACLLIKEIPEGSKYRIDEYDGNETVETPDSYEWKTA